MAETEVFGFLSCLSWMIELIGAGTIIADFSSRITVFYVFCSNPTIPIAITGQLDEFRGATSLCQGKFFL